MHCNEEPIYVFLFWELRGLSPDFHIHVSVSDFYIPRIAPHISCSRISGSIVGIYKSLTHLNVEIGTVAAQFLFREYLFQIVGVGSWQCGGGAEQRLNCLVHVPVVDVRLLEMEVVAHGDEQVARLLEALHLIIHQASEQPQHLSIHTKV